MPNGGVTHTPPHPTHPPRLIVAGVIPVSGTNSLPMCPTIAFLATPYAQPSTLGISATTGALNVWFKWNNSVDSIGIVESWVPLVTLFGSNNSWVSLVAGSYSTAYNGSFFIVASVGTDTWTWYLPADHTMMFAGDRWHR